MLSMETLTKAALTEAQFYDICRQTEIECYTTGGI